MNLSLKQQLKAWKKQQSWYPKVHDHCEEHLSEREWKELMGINQPVYKRGKGGSWKQY